MTLKKAKVGKAVIVKQESGSAFAGEVLTIKELNQEYATLTQNGEVQILNMHIKYLR